MPIKAMLQSCQRFALARESASFGVTVAGVRLDLAQVMRRKRELVDTLRAGIVQQLLRRGVHILSGEARFLSRTTIDVNGQRHTGARILIATGSQPAAVSIVGAQHPHVLTPAHLLAVEQLPAQLVVIGTTPVAISLASIFASLGTSVTIVDRQPALLPDWEPEISASLRDSLAPIAFRLNSEVLEITPSDVHIQHDGQRMVLPCDVVLLDAGRTPDLNIAGIESLDLDYDSSGIRVDQHMLTNLPDVYAAGAVTGLADSAHAAVRMGHVAVHTMLGKPDRFRQSAVPALIHGLTEAARIGLTEAQAIQRGIPVTVASSHSTATAAVTRADAALRVTPVARNMAKHHGIDLAQVPARGDRLDSADVQAFLAAAHAGTHQRFFADAAGDRGAYKVIVHRHTRQILGVHMIGTAVSEQVFGVAAMLEDEFRVDDVQQIIFPQLTLSAVFQDLIHELSISN
jgi:dihydrolipoamide dehydrogenase